MKEIERVPKSIHSQGGVICQTEKSDLDLDYQLGYYAFHDVSLLSHDWSCRGPFLTLEGARTAFTPNVEWNK